MNTIENTLIHAFIVCLSLRYHRAITNLSTRDHRFIGALPPFSLSP
ncbi:hypothetical protein HMPREF9244_00058 [Alloscardovia omnicolens F0580]|uniref:Uncharacterized protein n=1 Tax=Alloscardovia omnicolens F0580 TaxID=1321816 RepID=U1QXE6_9BIFI|nr:hypothetical protein HMPREF9244_00058 [Alloscardovia omnicolens F0580]